MATDGVDNLARVLATNDSSSLDNPHECDTIDSDLESWNPMVEDYTNRAFNNYTEPTTAELKRWMLKQGEQGPNEDLMACCRNKDGDIRLFVNGIPPELTQEGIKGLFSQAGKVVYCKVIPHRDPNKKDTFGFVGYQSYREAEKAIRLFDGFSLGERMRLKVSLSKKSRENDFPSDLDFKTGVPTENGNTEEENWESQYMPIKPGDVDCSVANGNDAVTNGNNVSVNGTTTGENDAITMETTDSNVTPIQNGQLSEMELPQQQDNVPKMMGQASSYGQPSNGVVHSTGSNVGGGEVRGNVQSADSKPRIPHGPCSLCGKIGNSRCSSCKIHYCSKHCQRTDWPEHKKFCNWMKAEQKEPEVTVIKKAEPYVIDEDEIDIPDPISFLSSFGAELHKNIEREVPAAAYRQDKYVDFDEEYIAVPQPSNRAQIREIDDTVNSPSIEEISTNDSQASKRATNPLITELTPNSSQFVDPEDWPPSMITKLNPEETRPVNSQQRGDTVKSVIGSSVSSTSNELLDPKPQLTLISEITSREGTFDRTEPQPPSATVLNNVVQSSKPLITELSSEDFHSQQSTVRETRETKALSEAIQGHSSSENHNMKQEAVKEKIEVFKRYRLGDLPCESLSINSWHDIVVTSVSSPNIFWVQLFQMKALQRQNSLYETLHDLYTNSTYKNYVPMVGDICVAQYSKDGSWYRSKVNYINNNGYINVSHIDFGSSEDVDASSIRRFTSDLAAIPVQGIKCCLHFPDSPQIEYSPEMIHAFYSKVLDVKCSAEVKDMKDPNVYCLEIYDANGSKINDMFKTKETIESIGDTRAVPASLPNTLPRQQMQPIGERSLSSDCDMSFGGSVQPLPDSSSTSVTLLSNSLQPLPENPTIALQSDDTTVPECLTHSNPTSQPTVASQKTQLDLETTTQMLPEQTLQPALQELLENPGSLHSLSSNIAVTSPSMTDQTENGQVASNVTSNPSFESIDRSERLSTSSSDVDQKISEYSSTRTTNHPNKPTFEAVVSSVVSPREFSMVRTDPALLVKLEELTTQLQSHCISTPYDPSVEYQFGEMCAIKSRNDKEWYRARVTSSHQKDRFIVLLSDVDAKETVTPEFMRPIPDSFKSVPPRRILCSLAFISKRAGSPVFGKTVIDRFNSLVLNKKFTCREIKKINSVSLVEILDESDQPSVARQLVDEGLVDVYTKKSLINPDDNYIGNIKPSLLLPCKGAITSAKLPERGQVFQATVTQFQSPTTFFIQLNDEQSKQKLEKLSQNMNAHYAGFSLPADWQARERQLCAAFFKSSWLRAFVQNITEDNVVTIYCVDYGNLEIVSSSALRPLVPEFSTLPYCALHCGLASLSPIDGGEWSKEAIDFVRVKMPLSSIVNVELVYKGQTVLFLDVILPTSERLSHLLVSKNFAIRGKFSPKKFDQRPFNQRVNESKDQSKQGFKHSQGSYQQRYKDGRSPPHRKFNESQDHQSRHFKDSHFHQRNNQNRSSPKKLDKIFNPKEKAIYFAKLPPVKEKVRVFATHITSPGCFAVQIADLDMVSKIASLQNDMNSHYNTATYYPYQPTINQVCAAQFQADDSWYRAWIEKIVDNKVYVYYPDYGNYETLDISRLRPLEPIFLGVPFAALTCALSSITSNGDWSEEATAFFREKIQLFQAIDVVLRFKKYDCIFVDIVDPENSITTLSKELVAKNLAAWMVEKKPRQEPPSPVFSPLAMFNDIREKKSRVETPEQVPEIPVKRFFLDALPLVPINHGDIYKSMVCDVSPQGIVSLQVLTKDVEELDTLEREVNSHCCVDQVAYFPIANELCFACFSENKEWYRAVVNAVLPGDQFKVTFVDYGNQDTVSPQSIRVISGAFLRLPRLAYTGPLKFIASSDQTPLPDDIIDTLKQQLLEKLSFVRVDEHGVEFFAVSPDGNQGPSLNEGLSQILYPQVGIPTEINEECVARVTEVNGSDIWIQRTDLVDLNELSTSINKYCEEGTAVPVTAPPSPGDVLLGKHSYFNKWYRVKVLESQPSLIRVLFVDHGYTEDVPLCNLRKPKPEFQKYPFQAAMCYLSRVAQGNSSANDFIKQILDREFKVKICEKKGDLLGVELEDYGVQNGPLNLNDYLIGFGYQA